MFGRGKKAKAQAQQIEELRAQIARINNAYPLSLGNYGSELYNFLTMGQTNAGKAVTEHTVMRIGAVYACIALIAGAVASMPLHIYRRHPNGDRERVSHPLGALLNEQPHQMLSAAVFWEYGITALMLHGDSFVEIVRGSGKSVAQAVALVPHNPVSVTVDVMEMAGHTRLVYIVPDDRTGGTRILDQDDMLHVPGTGFNGRRGVSPLRNALLSAGGVSLAADEYSAAFFANGARPDFALTAAGDITEEQADVLRQTWLVRYGGSGKAHLPAVLAGGLQVKELTMNSEDAQLLATRRFQVEDIARIYGVPPHMIGSTEKTTSWGSGVETMGIGFVTFTLQRYLTKFQQEYNRKLLRGTSFFTEFVTAGLKRGDTKSRYEAHRIALGRAGEPGFLTLNEVRRIENLPPVPNGDTINTQETPPNESQ